MGVVIEYEHDRFAGSVAVRGLSEAYQDLKRAKGSFDIPLLTTSENSIGTYIPGMGAYCVSCICSTPTITLRDPVIMYPKKVIVIGGSIAGLLQGLQLKRQGSHVIVLEQDPSKDRHSHESGVSIGKTVVALLDKYDATGRPAAIPSRYMSAAWQTWLRVGNTNWRHNMSNWGCLYLILRSNFDGLSSPCVPNPPPARFDDGQVEYRGGKQVKAVSYNQEKGIVSVEYVDVTTGETASESAEMVIAADGVHSTVRRLMGAPVRKEYSGYIGWRGTVKENLLSKETREYFWDRLNFSFLRRSYFISYYIPTEGGHTEVGERLINWVWYFVVKDGSSEMEQIFTDITGKVHPNTVPHGKINPNIWKAQIDNHIHKMTPHLAEIVTKTPKPFVTKVMEAQTHTVSFYDGHLVLVGDAMTGFRSHLGWASEQAARHAVQLDKVWRGEMTMKQRDEAAVLYAERFIRLNRMMGMTGMGWFLLVIWNALVYVWIVSKAYVGSKF